MQEFEQLVEAIDAAGVDITSNYNDWYKIAIAIANTFGEQCRSMFHRISKLYIDYNSNEADKKYNKCLRDPNPQIRINTIYYYVKQAGVKLPHASQYAPFTHGAQTTVVERFLIKAVFSFKQPIRYYSSLSVIICYYPALSGIKW